MSALMRVKTLYLDVEFGQQQIARNLFKFLRVMSIALSRQSTLHIHDSKIA